MIIDTKAYTRKEFLSHVNGLSWTNFSPTHSKPIGLTLHNTWRPLIADWTETDPGRLNTLNGLKSYYEGMGWHAGPHGFISRDFINGFSPLTAWGIHSTCFNKTHLGLEMVGDYEAGGEAFDSGSGAMVCDNAVFAIAALMNKLGLNPEKDLVFHRDCTADHHACPGSSVNKGDIEARIRAMMTTLSEPPPPENTYTVVKGDDLYEIARRFGTTVATLVLLNGLTAADKIEVGQILKLKE